MASNGAAGGRDSGSGTAGGDGSSTAGGGSGGSGNHGSRRHHGSRWAGGGSRGGAGPAAGLGVSPMAAPPCAGPPGAGGEAPGEARRGHPGAGGEAAGEAPMAAPPGAGQPKVWAGEAPMAKPPGRGLAPMGRQGLGDEVLACCVMRMTGFGAAVGGGDGAATKAPSRSNCAVNPAVPIPEAVHKQKRAPCCRRSRWSSGSELSSLMPALPMLSRGCNNHSCNVCGAPGTLRARLR